jgi:ribosomal-protein-alanine N-acetyltransferase
MTGEKWKIRPMRRPDVDQVVALADILPQAPRWAREMYETALDPAGTPRRVALVAQKTGPGDESGAGEVVGFAIGAAVAFEAELESIGVAPEWQRHGVGRTLLEALLRTLKELGVTKLTLEVRASNDAAQKLYRTLGFEDAGLRRGYYSDPKEDAVVMILAPGLVRIPQSLEKGTLLP